MTKRSCVKTVFAYNSVTVLFTSIFSAKLQSCMIATPFCTGKIRTNNVNLVNEKKRKMMHEI